MLNNKFTVIYDNLLCNAYLDRVLVLEDFYTLVVLKFFLTLHSKLTSQSGFYYIYWRIKIPYLYVDA